jgi:hypothetical protein
LKVCAAIHHGPRCGGILRHFAPLSCRQMIALESYGRNWVMVS